MPNDENAEPAKPDDWYEIRRLTMQGKSASEISIALGCSTRKVSRARRFFGLSPKPVEATLPVSAEKLAAAAELLEDNWSFVAISEKLHIHTRTLVRYFNGRQVSREESIERATMARALNRIQVLQ